MSCNSAPTGPHDHIGIPRSELTLTKLALPGLERLLSLGVRPAHMS